jgi:hypothetical protein
MVAIEMRRLRGVSSRRIKETLERFRLDIFLPEERFVGGVFQETAHEIGHSWQKFSDRRIEAKTAVTL